MPYTMIHLMAAHELLSTASDLFWVGNVAPDYTNDRQLKDAIHLRNTPDVWMALSELFRSCDTAQPFIAGVMLHLFVDACWEETQVNEFRQIHAQDDWFMQYRQEMMRANMYIYHHCDWGKGVMAQIKQADLHGLNPPFPLTYDQIEWWRGHVVDRHENSEPELTPSEVFTPDMLSEFAKDTARRYANWAGRI